MLIPAQPNILWFSVSRIESAIRHAGDEPTSNRRRYLCIGANDGLDRPSGKAKRHQHLRRTRQAVLYQTLCRPTFEAQAGERSRVPAFVWRLPRIAAILGVPEPVEGARNTASPYKLGIDHNLTAISWIKSRNA